MKKLVWEDDVEDIDVGDGDVISIAASISVNDLSDLDDETRGKTLLQRLVRGWRGPGFERNGEPVPVTLENIKRLEVSVANLVSERIMAKLQATRLDDGERKDSEESSSSISASP